MRGLRAVLAALLLAACYPPLPTLVPTLGPPPATATVPTAAATPTEPARAAADPPTSAPAPNASPAPPATDPPTAPPPTGTPVATPPPAITLLFTGDINPGRCPAQIALARDDFTVSYQFVGETLRAADLAIGSLDGSISDQSAPSPCPQTMNLIGPSRTVEGLTYAGFDLITVATNHAKDCGSYGWNCQERAFNDTQANLNAAGIRTVGGGADLAAARAPVILEARGVRFAFLGVTEVGAETWASASVPGTAPLSAEALPGLLADIAAARAQADVVIVLPQWGVEYAPTPTAYQQDWAAAMFAAGATLIIGNHPHTVQPVVETATPEGARAVVAYALGNFVFDQGPWENRQGVLLRATFTGAALTGYELLPIHIYSLYQPRFADPTEAAAILQRADPARLP
ncbi:MAG: CapA family protein [Anaerolineales bacterium]|nr:CapA family protein [Anaerolineales bacterium]